MTDARKKSLMRNIGEFFGHVFKAVRTDPSKRSVIVKKDVQEEDRGDMTLRRTTIEEIEFKKRETED